MLRRIGLESARSRAFPEGSTRHGYERALAGRPCLVLSAGRC